MSEETNEEIDQRMEDFFKNTDLLERLNNPNNGIGHEKSSEDFFEMCPKKVKTFVDAVLEARKKNI